TLLADESTRPVVSTTIDEFLAPPVIYVKDDFLDDYQGMADELPPHSFKPTERGRASFELIFFDLASRERARAALDGAGMRYRTGKTLVPFRITGNITWGVPAPTLEGDGETRRTVWCWPESLWAPISFTQAWLEAGAKGVESLNAAGQTPSNTEAKDWENYWCSPDAAVYQFIGQDNIYVYGVAQTALWEALSSASVTRDGGSGGRDDGNPTAGFDGLQQSRLVANYHLLFLDKKASSSGAIRPPMADELLDYYTAEQLRAHFLSLGLGMRPVSFKPKPLNPQANERDADPVLKEGTLLTNVFNRLARSCFYTAQTSCSGLMPLSPADDELVAEAHETIMTYERLMYKQELHAVMHLMDAFIRRANKYWSEAIRQAGEDDQQRAEVLRNAFYLLRICTVLMHPIVPQGTQMIFEQFAFDVDEREFFSWEHILEPGYAPFLTSEDIKRGGHPFKELPPRTDFFNRHPNQ
ncbi:MAG: class I tRNA ligase family protein, partial [Coriobacteriales bacterium]|nr:class I tRNA ligase family protein [Coriobacteriales bacterium]